MLRGRLNITITNTKIVLCVWQEQIITIAIMIGVSQMTLHRHHIELGLEEEICNSKIDDCWELDVFVRSILEMLPHSGEVMIQGALHGRRVNIQRSWL